ncbi:flagellar type III secretion system pore protein FliP [Candidatus Liberibacter asiaticus]|uniref:Flagellar biosynthetic protein FliP n=2 Tax=Liberibacter asiaticus TaxID=34021 RepID=C6XHV2_LIBAP|nr:flagellar type III secretion system pore protein FliP [Candidatus Liberibacter asiaticus]ACT56845.1 flagellar biosynthesis protein FliP [Candidatus Liberibacter asiaticus str. psy62]AGH16609.1 flagellar biosynthesis protein FliP [Candidatus Liberibacter asiaticus str. gxpsy]ALK07000.1 flagellar type III secretion system pore protein FliP [Candidatus Liberibacter asiaticus]ASK52471.1 flagellar biosynthetic protein FliP [Candidatus Liberibacter asiaticus]AWL13795.1 flagellar biosynthetic prot
MIRYCFFALFLVTPELVFAKSSLHDVMNIPADLSISTWIVRTFGIFTILSIAPILLIMVTCFPRFIIVFSILRTGMGMGSVPPNLVIISLALFMTFYVMSPTLDRSIEMGIQPLMNNQITETTAIQRVAEPFWVFMRNNTREKDLSLFMDMAHSSHRNTDITKNDHIEYRILIPSFMISELRRSFEIGFLIILPFLIIDMIVATIVMAMGMMMLPPTSISLPFKVIFFVLIDGWSLLVENLVKSFI